MAERAAAVEVLPGDALARIELELRGALRRKPAQEARLAGVLRELVPHSGRIREVASLVFETLLRRGSFERPLYRASVRVLAEVCDERSMAGLARALDSEPAGGLAGLSAAGLCASAALAAPLAKLAASRHPQLALAAEAARIARRESNGAYAAAVAPKVKEAHRIALCAEVFLPLSFRKDAPAGLVPALGLLREAERHLGRWLVLAELGARAGDERPRAEASERAQSGASGARGAWGLVEWALARDTIEPKMRATLELVQRLSDRPSADRDTGFLFRLASARVAGARPLLETLNRAPLPANEQALRASLHLARDYGDPGCKEKLIRVSEHPRREPLRGLVAAALYDVGECERALRLLPALDRSTRVPALAWAGLVRAASLGRIATPLVSEARFRRIERGWVE